MKDKNELAGIIELRPDRFKAELGYALGRPHWGKGIMTEAARRVTDWAMNQPEICRVWALCDVDNTASARVLEKIGMQFEGILRRFASHPNRGDQPRDCRCYGKVK